MSNETGYFGTGDHIPNFTDETPLEGYTRLVDKVSSRAEAENGCQTRDLWYVHDGIYHKAKAYDPYHLRTYTATVVGPSKRRNSRAPTPNALNTKVVYPKILFVHGLASSELFFRDQALAMAKLGIRSKAIDLPPIPSYKSSPEELWQWQVGAVINLFDSMSEDGNDVVIIGHSRGAQLSAFAAREILQRDGTEDNHLAGLMLQGPAITEAMRVKSIRAGLVSSAFVGLNSLTSHPERGRSLIMDIGRVVLTRPEQVITEARQAMTVSIRDILLNDLKSIPVDIEYAHGDEFMVNMYPYVVDLLDQAANQPDRTGLLTAIDRDSTNHMLSAPADLRGNVITLADPRMSSGHILAFLQSAVGFYSPTAITKGKDGRYRTSRDPIGLAA